MSALEIYAVLAPVIALVAMGCFGFVLLRRDMASFKLASGPSGSAATSVFSGSGGAPTSAAAGDTAVRDAGGAVDLVSAVAAEDLSVGIAEQRPGEPRSTAAASDFSAPAAVLGEPPPISFDEAWPKSERVRAADAARGGVPRPAVTFTEAGDGATIADRPTSAAPEEGQPPVTVLKAGVVDGMSYSLYSDGSIEAQMPEGTQMRFASLDELRAHLDQRS